MWRELLNADRLAFDIEIDGPQTLSCVAFAARTDRAYVFPAARLGEIREILESPVPKVAQNGQFDLYFLRTRCDIEVNNYADDTIIGWHACYPELASASQDRRKSAKRTRKSLAFLASLYTTDEWWKDYEFESADEEYRLCGRDACITLDIMQQLDNEIDRLGVREIYTHQLRLIEPCIRMQERGLAIDDELRRERIEALSAKADTLQRQIEPIARTLLTERRDRVERENLFWTTKTCECCRNGAAKRLQCWSCAGFERSPTKAMMQDVYGPFDGLKAEMEARFLGPCGACDARGQWEVFEYNPQSNDQNKILLYDVLKLPPRHNNGKLSTNEESLKSLLGVLQDA